MKKSIPVLQQVRFIVAGFFLLLTILFGLSLFNNLQQINKSYLDIAEVSANALFIEILSTRKWNASHGGVYVIENEKIKPNPYLKDKMRDITTNKGLKLTKINPAFMTRMISSILLKEKGISFHITSLNPLNPNNKADPWEQKALKNFERGIKKMTLLTVTNPPIFRYIEPLKTEKSCLNCHAIQGYKLGDIRGGISINLPFAIYQNSMNEARLRVILFHIVALFISSSIVIFFSIKLTGAIKKLKEARNQITELSGLLPICSGCKNIRDDKGYWSRVETVIESHSEIQFSHGLCPNCADKLYGEKEWYKELKKDENNEEKS